MWKVRPGMVTCLARGIHISLEGIDGSGKTTQAQVLLNWLRANGYRAKYTAEPTYGRIGSVIRLHVYRIRNTPPEYEALLFAADRIEHYQRFIRPLLERGFVVLSDRYVHSSLAYQGTALKDVGWVRDVNQFTPPPDLAILIDVPIEVALQRKKSRRIRFEKREVLLKVSKEYRRLVECGEMEHIDGGRALEEVSSDLIEIVAALLRRKRLPARASLQRAESVPL